MGHSPVMLSPFVALRVHTAKHLSTQRDRPFAEFTLSEANGFRVTVEGPISSSVLFCDTASSAQGVWPYALQDL